MNNVPNKSARILSVIGFSVLATLCGVGVAWLAVAITGVVFLKQPFDRIVDGITPLLFAGGVIGLILGLIVPLQVAGLDPISKKRVLKRFVGGRSGRLTIYVGAPLFVVIAFAPLMETLSHHVSVRAAVYSYFGFYLVMLAVSLFLYDRIPRRFIVPIGIMGWLMIALLTVVSFFKMQLK